MSARRGLALVAAAALVVVGGGAALERRLSAHSGLACTVARLDPGTLRKRFGDTTNGLGPLWGQDTVTAPLGRGEVVESQESRNHLFWLSRLTAYDAAGHVIWRRSVRGHHLGVVDARDGRVLMPVLGEYTPGTD